jgi:hypothetical protein
MCQSAGFHFRWLILVVLFLAASCSEVPNATEADAGESGADAQAVDSSHPEPRDGDAGCACTTVDAATGGIGEMSLACYCSQFRCPRYEDAITCPEDAEPSFYWLETYPNCPLVAVRSDGGYKGNLHYYDAVTHELVGAAASSDIAELACGENHVFRYLAGTVWSPSCGLPQRVNRCSSDGGQPPDADAASEPETDVGCACDVVDAAFGAKGSISLPCFCSRFGCRTYEDDLAACEAQDASWFSTLTYPNCNLIAIDASQGSGVSLRYYDSTTHELVGASDRGDTDGGATCGARRVFGYNAGVVPGPSCGEPQRAPRCRPDGGDAGIADGATSDADADR